MTRTAQTAVLGSTPIGLALLSMPDVNQVSDDATNKGKRRTTILISKVNCVIYKGLTLNGLSPASIVS